MAREVMLHRSIFCLFICLFCSHFDQISSNTLHAQLLNRVFPWRLTSGRVTNKLLFFLLLS